MLIYCFDSVSLIPWPDSLTWVLPLVALTSRDKPP